MFVDAALPEAAYHARQEFLATLADPDGTLSPWSSWWDESEVAELFPDAGTRSRVEAEQARMPLAYWSHPPPSPEGWDRVPCGYVWFGEPYDAGARQAATRGWLTSHVPGRHLHMLIDPSAVATAVLEMVDHRG